jgi:hypothetical protein
MKETTLGPSMKAAVAMNATELLFCLLEKN